MRTALFILLLVSSAATAQLKIKDTSLYKVRFICKHYYDTTDLTKVRIDTMNLFAGKKYSMIRNAGYEAYEANRDQQVQQAYRDHIAGMPIHFKGIPRVPLTEIFRENEGQKIFAKDVLFGVTYFIPDSTPVINWSIMADTRKLGPFTCQKAVGRYKGRTYTAWFTSDLPVQTGPWSLKGLPGTILEAADARKHVLFLFDGYETVQKTFASPDKYRVTSKKEWDKLMAAYEKDPMALMNNQTGIKTTFSVTGNQKPLPAKKPINNPLILPDK